MALGDWKCGWLPHLSWHHGLMIAIVVDIALWSLVLAGCSSTRANMPSLYIFGASYDNAAQASQSGPSYLETFQNLTQNAHLDVRAGFFSLCVRIPTAIQGQASWDCGSRATLTDHYGASVDPLDLITYLDVFANKVVFYGLIIGSIALQIATFGILATYPGWETSIDDDGLEHEIKQFPGRHTTWGVLYLSASAIFLGIFSMLWIHVAAVSFGESLEQLTGGLVSTTVGAAVMGIGWIAVGLAAFVPVMTIAQIASIAVLDVWTDEDES